MTRRIVDQAVSPRRGHQHGRILRGVEIEPPARVPFYAQKLTAGIGVRPDEIGARGDRVRLHVVDTLRSEQERTDEYQEGHEARYGNAGQAEKGGLSDSSERKRPPRLHGDLPHEQLALGLDG